MDLMTGPMHTNLVCSMTTTVDRLHSLGLDKNLKTASTTTNEYRSVFHEGECAPIIVCIIITIQYTYTRVLHVLVQ